MPAAPLAPAYVEAGKPPAGDVEAGHHQPNHAALPVSSAAAAAAAPPPPTAVVGAALPPRGGDHAAKVSPDPFDPSSSDPAAPARRGCGLAPAVVGWLLFALGWLVSLIWIVGLPVANRAPGTCGQRASVLLASPNPLAQLVNYEKLRALVECRIFNNVALTAAGAVCLVPWLLGSLVPCCCTGARRPQPERCASLAAAKSRYSRAAGANTLMSILGAAALAGLVAMCAVEYREAKKMDAPEQRAQLEALSAAAKGGQAAAVAVDGLIEQVGQALGIPLAPAGVGSAASGDGLLGQLFKP